MKKILSILLIALCTGCHQNNSNCPFNSVLGNYTVTDNVNGITNCTANGLNPCPTYNLVVASSGNCNSILIKNFGGSGSTITANYLSSFSSSSVFQVPGQTFQYLGNTYEITSGATVGFNGTAVTITLTLSNTNGTNPSEISTQGTHQ